MQYNSFNHFLLRVPSNKFNLLESSFDFENLIRNHQFQEAIYIASSTLYKELNKYLLGNLQNKKEQERLFYSLKRYLNRMSTRSTPFGLFAGCSVGEIGNETQIVLAQTSKKQVRMDMYFLCSLSQYLLQLPAVREKMRYYPNTSLYLLGKKYRYIESRYAGVKRISRISSVERSDYLNKLLGKAKNGETIESLCSAIQSPDIGKEEAWNFILELIENQILVGELSPTVTGDDFLNSMIRILNSYDLDDPIYQLMKEIQALLQKITYEDDSVSIFQNITEKVKSINIGFDENLLFQVDMSKETVQSTLGQKVIEELKSTMQFLNRVTPADSNMTLARFQQLFYARYEDREVPLMEALDPEIGIGYPPNSNSGDISPLLERFILPPAKEQGYSTPSNYFHSILLEKTLQTLSQKGTEIVLTDNDIKDFPPAEWSDLPATISAMIELLQADAENVLIKLNSMGGSCAANLLARFCHADEKITQFVSEIVDKEQALMPDVVLAEIAHLPETRVGNILSRPHLRNYEILYLAHSALPANELIYMSDLVLSIKQGRLYLRSKRLNKEIIPRLTNAHNFHNNPTPVYVFLCDMQVQKGRGGLHFSWGELGNQISFLPRVRYKNTILSPATWKVKIADIKHLFAINGEELIKAIDQWRESIHLPGQVLLLDGDNQLFVDWKDIHSILALYSIIKKRMMVQFSEFLFDPEKAVVRDTNQNPYLNECIVCFYKDEKK